MPDAEEVTSRLEWACNKYRADPSTVLASVYRRVAVRAWFAKEIDDQALLKVLHEIRDRELDRCPHCGVVARHPAGNVQCSSCGQWSNYAHAPKEEPS